MKGKILFINQTHEYLPDFLTSEGWECVFHFQTSKEKLQNLLPQFDGLVCKSRFKLDKTFLEKGTKLKFVARAGAGYEHIDDQFLLSQNIPLLTSPEGSRTTVGEHTIGMLLGLLNNLNRADRQVRNGLWIRQANNGVELAGKTVGIIGYGHMGSAFAKRLAGFECNVLAYDKYKKDYSDEFAQEATMEELWASADVISFHIPFMESNKHLVDKSFFDRFKKPIWLVNTARGDILVTADLVEAMEQGKVLGAALDVIEYEEGSFENFSFENLPAPFQYLIKSDRTVLAPHIAGWSFESYEGHARVLAEKIKMVLG